MNAERFKTSNRRLKSMVLSAALILLCACPLSIRAGGNLAEDAPDAKHIVADDNTVANHRQRWYLGAMMVGLLAIAGWHLRTRKSSNNP